MVMTWTARALTEEEHDAVRSDGKAAATLIEDEPPDPQRGVDLDTAWPVSYTHLTLPTNREV